MSREHFAPGLTTPTQPSRRLYYLDWLRVIALLVLLVYHCNMIFDPSHEWLIKSPAQWPWLVHLDNFVSQWRLPLLFFVSGVSTSFALGYRSALSYTRDRLRRLIIPYVLAVLLLVPPQIYIQRLLTPSLGPAPIQDSLLAFYPAFWLEQIHQGYISSEHVWFLRDLFLFSILALPFFLWWRGQREGPAARLINSLAQGRRLLLFVLPLVLGEVALLVGLSLLGVADPTLDTRPSAPLFRATYFYFFVYGFLIATSPSINQAALRNRHLCLVLAIGSLALQGLFSWIEQPVLLIIAKQAHIWLWVTALIGYAQVYLTRSNRFLRYATELIVPFYVFHQTVIVLLAFYVLPLPLPSPLHYLGIVAGSFAISVLLAELARSNRFARMCFGMGPLRPARAQPAAQPLEAASPQSLSSQSGPERVP